jgi:hypothetical protein
MKHFLKVDNEVIFLPNGWIWYYCSHIASLAQMWQIIIFLVKSQFGKTNLNLHYFN